MTTQLDVRAFVAPLLARNSDLALVGRGVFLKPLRHVSVHVYIDRSGAKELFIPCRTTSMVFSPMFHLASTTSNRIYRGNHSLWTTEDIESPVAFAKKLEEQIITEMRDVVSIDKFAEFVTNPDNFENHDMRCDEYQMLFLQAALGNFEAADAEAEILRRPGRDWSVYPELWPKRDQALLEFYPAVKARDRKAVAAMLHRYEEENVQRFKLGQIWERTPFPVEEG